MFKIFCFGDIFALYLASFISSEYKDKSKVLKFSLFKLPIFDLLKSISNIFCFIQLQSTLLPNEFVTKPVSLQIVHSY